MAGFTNPTLSYGSTQTPAFTGGTDTSGAAAPSTVTPSSGTPFTPSTSSDCFLLVPIAATTAGTVTITVGGVTYVPSSNLVALSEPTFTVPVRKNQSVTITVTGTTVAIGTVTVVPH